MDWPYDTAEHVFLGRAMQRVGAALFGNAWSGGAADEDDVSDGRQLEEAIDAIARAAAAGELAVVVRLRGRGLPPIKPEALADPDNWRAWRESYFADLGSWFLGPERWAALFVARRDLEALESRLAALPARAGNGGNPLAAEPAKLTAGAEDKCQTWLRGQVQASPDLRPKPRSAFKAEATALFPGLSGRSFDRAWTAETKGTAWVEGGRPPHKPPAQNPRTKTTAPK